MTIQTAPFTLDAIRTSRALAGKRFAVIVDEAHSSQPGETANKLRQTLSARSSPRTATSASTTSCG